MTAVARWALHVDAGWLFAAGSTLVFGEPVPRRDLRWDPTTVVEALRVRAAQLVPATAEHLRTYWYDGSPNRLPIGDQHELAALDDVKLRLGRTSPNGQKGVDGLIIHDIITLALRQNVTDAVVLSADEDLLDAIESAQASGSRVHLLEIPIGGIAPALRNCFDRTATLDGASLQDLLTRVGSPPPDGSAVPDPPPPTGEADVDLIVEPSGRALPRPKWMTLPQLPSEPLDAEPADVSAVVEFGEQFAQSWLVDATDDEYADLLASRPYLGGGLDGRLLRGVGRWLSEEERRALRDSFWSTIAGNLPGEQ